MVMKEISNALTLAEQIQLALISEELPEWKKRQQNACIGGPHNTCLEQLQSWWEPLAGAVDNISWGLFHKTSLPNKPGLFQLVWLIVWWFGSK